MVLTMKICLSDGEDEQAKHDAIHDDELIAGVE